MHTSCLSKRPNNPLPYSIIPNAYKVSCCRLVSSPTPGVNHEKNQRSKLIGFISNKFTSLSTFSTDATSKLDILGHDGDTLGMDGAQVGIFEQAYKVSLAGLLESTNGGALEAQVGLEILSDFTNKALEGQLADQKLSRLLVATDFAESDGTRAEAMCLLDTTRRGGALAGGLGRELLAGCLTTGGLAGSLLSTGHG